AFFRRSSSFSLSSAQLVIASNTAHIANANICFMTPPSCNRYGRRKGRPATDWFTGLLPVYSSQEFFSAQPNGAPPDNQFFMTDRRVFHTVDVVNEKDFSSRRERKPKTNLTCVFRSLPLPSKI